MIEGGREGRELRREGGRGEKGLREWEREGERM